MKRKGKNPSLFQGFCNKCSEVYEAQSATDNLSGVQFKCRKLLCDGKVTLEVAAIQSQISHVTQSHEAPKRYS